MQEQKYDMEVTDYRANQIWKTLAMLYAHQKGMEVERITIYSADPNRDTDLPKRSII